MNHFQETYIRPAAVAGQFYPDDPATLKAQVSELLNITSPQQATPPKVLIVPHAGYRFSGQAAGVAYQRLYPFRDHINRVVLLGPCHRVAVKGVALSSHDFFQTPLGNIPIDPSLRERISVLPQIKYSNEAHEHEHSLEVHLPFLQTVLKRFTLLPLVVGQADMKVISDILESLWGDANTLIIISTDLSHFLDYDACQTIDQQTVQMIEKMQPHGLTGKHACGHFPLKGLLHRAKVRHMAIETIRVYNSGDTQAGQMRQDRVVGYGAWALTGGQTPDEIESFAHQARLAIYQYARLMLELTANSIRHSFSRNKPIHIRLDKLPPEFSLVWPTFVTLETKDGNLRGCIGNIQPNAALAQSIANNAFRAAFQDQRFTPVTSDELKSLHIQISILSPLVKLEDHSSESRVLEQITPNQDGLVITTNQHRGVFLPSVWQKIPDKQQFLQHLKRKAGLPDAIWPEDIQVARFISESLHSKDLAVPTSIWQ